MNTIGTGKTKKDARMQAAEKALEFLIKNPEYIQKPTQEEKNNKKQENQYYENTTEEPDEINDDETSPKRLKTLTETENETLNCQTDLDDVINDVKIPNEPSLKTVIEEEAIPALEDSDLEKSLIS